MRVRRPRRARHAVMNGDRVGGRARAEKGPSGSEPRRILVVANETVAGKI